MRGNVDSVCGVVNDTRNVSSIERKKNEYFNIFMYCSSIQKLIERGQKLGDVEIASKQMSERAEEFASLTHKVMLKHKEKAERWSFTSKKS